MCVCEGGAHLLALYETVLGQFRLHTSHDVHYTVILKTQILVGKLLLEMGYPGAPLPLYETLLYASPELLSA